MFKLQPDPTFWAKVPIGIPGKDKPAEVEFEFRHLGVEAMKAFGASLGEHSSDANALAQIVVGWRGVDAPFDREALDRLLDNYPSAAMSLFEVFGHEAGAAKRKNS